MICKEKIKALVTKYQSEMDNNDLGMFAVELIRECGAITFKKMEKALECDLSHYIRDLYCVIDDVVFSADKTYLVKYDPEKTDIIYNIPPFVTTIGDEAFKDNSYIEQVVFDPNVLHIGSYAFQNCSSLEKIVWGAAKSSGSNVFVECPRLKTICASDANVFWNYCCDNLGSPFINGARLLINGKECSTITVPGAVTNGTMRAFKGCTSIKHIEFDENNAYIEKTLLNVLKSKDKVNFI